MTLERDILLISNGIVRSYNTTELYCVICESDTSYATCIKHMSGSLHQQNLQWFSSIFRTCGNNVKCAICNTVIPWGKLKIHSKMHIKIPWLVPDDRYDKYKIFFENQMFQWTHLFHCCLCAATLSSCETALVHITDPKHQSLKEETPLADNFLPQISVPWETLVCESLINFNTTELQCRFCSCKNVTLCSVGRHIKGLIHLRNKSKFQLKLPDSEIGNLVTTAFTGDSEPEDSEPKDLEPEDSESEHLEPQDSKPEHLEPQDSKSEHLEPQDSKPEHLEPQDSKSEHLEPEEHEFAHENEAIASPKNDLKVKEDSQQARPKLDFIFRQNDSSSYCIICSGIVSNHAKDDHKMEAKHVAALKRYGCEAITQKNSVDYYCGHCDCMISSAENLYRHIIGKKHLKTLRTIMDKRKYNAENFSVKDHPKVSLRQDSPCNYIVRFNSTDLRCSVCDCLISATAINEEIHLTGKHHAKSLRKYGCERITFRGGDIYHCGYCDVMISHPENVYLHIKEASHMNSLTMADKRNSVNTMKSPRQEENSQEISVHTTEFAREIRTPQKTANDQSMKIATPQKTANDQSLKIATRETTDVWLKKIASNGEKNSDVQQKSLTSEEISKTADNSLASNHILKLGNMMFFCRICDFNIVPPLTVDGHVEGKRHAESLEHFFNEISEITNDRYYCKCCNWTIYGTDNVYSHLQGSRHKKLINTLNGAQSLENAKSSRDDEQYYRSKSSYVAISHPEDVGLNIKETSHMNSMPVAEKRHPEATINITRNKEVLRKPLDVRRINISNKAEDSTKNCPELQPVNITSKKGTSSEASVKKGSKFEFSDVWGLACPSLSCNYVTVKPSGSYCEICDVQLSNGIRTHVTGSEHSSSLKKYGCDNISLMGDPYYCACCECDINGCENVYKHVKGRKHLLHNEALASKRQLDALQKRIKEMGSGDPETELSSMLYSITAEISRLMEQLKRNGSEQAETN